MQAAVAEEGIPWEIVYASGVPGFDGFAHARGVARSRYQELWAALSARGPDALEVLQREAELSLRNLGITFTVYADEKGVERIFPFDVLPRILRGSEWAALEAGVQQRLRALNLFLTDVYGPQEVLRDGVVPTERVLGSPHFCREMVGVPVPGDVFVHVAGVDLIQDECGRFLVLEDNLRVPSGVSYVIENRRVMSRLLPDLLQRGGVRSVDHYPQLLLAALGSLAPRPEPRIAVLTPGVHNSAYFEHGFLAAEMGVELVEGRDLVVDQDVLYMKTTRGLARVDVLYRRVDTAFLDPLAFRADSMLGVAGLMHACRAGNVVLANAPGTGVADDKALYAYVPELIRYYLGEEPLLPQVPTFLCGDPEQRAHVLERLPELVVKPVDGAGGYGVTVGPTASDEELARAREDLLARPDHFIAQPTQRLSTLPTWVDTEGGVHAVEPRHVDLRPFAVTDANGRTQVLPGGLTRVALRKGNLVVNSSQGGGSKDTWVLWDGEGAGC